MFTLMYQAEPSSTELDPGAPVEPVQEEVIQSGNVGRKRSFQADIFTGVII